MLDTLQLYGDSLALHGTLPRMGSVTAFMPGNDPWIGTVLMLCLVALLLALASGRRVLKTRIMALAASSGSRAAQDAAAAHVTFGERWRVSLYILLQGVMFSLLHISWLAFSRPCFCGMFLDDWGMVATPVMLLAFEALLCVAVTGLRRLLYQWIHVTFFEREARMRWRFGYCIAMGVEALLLTLSACAFCQGLYGAQLAVHCAILSVFIPKIWLLWCAWRVFFVKSRTLLHFFAYLCSAELIPLAILWLLLGAATHLLTV